MSKLRLAGAVLWALTLVTTVAAAEDLTVREIADGDICCGSAGLYNLEQPEIAETLGAAKARAVVASGAEAVVAGNVGCLVQIAAHLERTGHPMPVQHTMQLLDRARLPGSG